MSTRPRDAGGQVFRSSVEVYGFVLWITTIISFILFVLWSFTPEDVIISLGVTYYPSKWWAIAVPSYVFMLFVFIFAFYVAYNMMNTNPLDSYHTITDSFASRQHDATLHEAAGLSHPDSGTSASSYSIPEIVDLPISEVNRLLYSHGPSSPPPPSSTAASPSSAARSPLPPNLLRRRT